MIPFVHHSVDMFLGLVVGSFHFMILLVQRASETKFACKNRNRSVNTLVAPNTSNIKIVELQYVLNRYIHAKLWRKFLYAKFVLNGIEQRIFGCEASTLPLIQHVFCLMLWCTLRSFLEQTLHNFHKYRFLKEEL